MIREVGRGDEAPVMAAAEACGLFEPEELPTLRAQLDKTLAGRADRGEFWLADFDADGDAHGVAYCVEELMTGRVWNLLFIGVRQDEHRVGLGSALLEYVEQRLRADGQRMLVIETTNGDEFEQARSFYLKHGYGEEGTVRDFYADGAHKIVFRKLL